MRVEIFDCNSAKELQDELNKFLEVWDSKVYNIMYSTNADAEYWGYSAMVTYDNTNE